MEYLTVSPFLLFRRSIRLRHAMPVHVRFTPNLVRGGSTRSEFKFLRGGHMDYAKRAGIYFT